MDPLVSVVIPAWNCSRWIEQTLESVYGQTYRDWEVVVVDDGSTDDTAQMLTRHRDRIRYCSQRNAGTAAARNAGIARARGELIAFLDNDDVWMPEKLERQVRAIQRWPECGLVFTDGRQFTEAGFRSDSVVSPRLSGWLDRNGTDDPEVFNGRLWRELLRLNEIKSASSVMVPRAVLERVGGFDESIRIADDYDLWLRIAQCSPILLIKRCLYMWRWRDDSQSGPVGGRRLRWTESSLCVLEKHLPVLPRDVQRTVRRTLADMYWDCGRMYFWQDRFAEGRRMFLGYLRHQRWSPGALAFLGVSYLSPAVIGAGRGVLKRFRRGRS